MGQPSVLPLRADPLCLRFVCGAGQQWREIRHDNTVTWLAMWKDPVNTKETKYVWLGATSSWKADSDQQK